MARAAALIIEADHVAVIERRNTSSPLPYYVFPGGRIEDGETPPQAAVREAWEELGVRIVVKQLVAEVVYCGDTQYYFAATVMGGRFGSGTGAEMTGTNAPEDGTYTPVWMSLARLPVEPVYPRGVAALIVQASAAGWSAACIHFEDAGRLRR